MRTLACRAYWTALEGRPGVVHLNFPLREPLVSRRAPAGGSERPRDDGLPYVARAPLTAQTGARGAERPCGARHRVQAGCRRGGTRRAPHDGRKPVCGRGGSRVRGRCRLAAAGRSAVRRPPRRSRDRSLRRPPARSGVHGVTRSRPDPASRRPAGLKAPAHVAGGPASARARWRSTPRAPGRIRPRCCLTRSRSTPRTPSLSSSPRRRAARGDDGSPAGAAPMSSRPRRSSACSPAAGSQSRRSRPSSASCCRRRRPCSWPPRCRCGTSRPSGRCARTRRECCATAARTASTAPCRAPSAPRPPARARSCC